MDTTDFFKNLAAKALAVFSSYQKEEEKLMKEADQLIADAERELDKQNIILLKNKIDKIQ